MNLVVDVAIPAVYAVGSLMWVAVLLCITKGFIVFHDCNLRWLSCGDVY
jgi:hypothetical protein